MDVLVRLAAVTIHSEHPFADPEDVRDRAARSLKRFLGQKLARKPLVMVVTVPHP